MVTAVSDPERGWLMDGDRAWEVRGQSSVNHGPWSTVCASCLSLREPGGRKTERPRYSESRISPKRSKAIFSQKVLCSAPLVTGLRMLSHAALNCDQSGHLVVIVL